METKPHHDAQPNHEAASHHDTKHIHKKKKGGDHKKSQKLHYQEGGHLIAPEERKRLLEVFGNLTKEQKDACDKKSWENEHKNHTEEEKAAWKKFNKTEKDEKKWNVKSDEEKACTVHKMEEFAKKRRDHPRAKGGHSGELVTREEEKRLLEVFDKMNKDQQEACDKKSWNDQFKNLTEEEKTAWEKMNQTEQKEKKQEEWNTKSDEEKACFIHKIELIKKKMMGRGEEFKRRGEENRKRAEGNKKQRGEKKLKKLDDENNKRRGSDKNGNTAQNSRRSSSDKNANGNIRGQQKVEDQVHE